jgi:NAD(P)-dependent dehydrogenase (short-subunit alcohol dehydrogenase family)
MNEQPVAVVTGASRGLGLELVREFVARDWRVIVDARDQHGLARAVQSLGDPGALTTVPGDVADPAHRAAIAAAVTVHGRLDVLVNNASTLGPSPLPKLADIAVADVRRLFDVNTIAPLSLIQLLLPWLEHCQGRIINISSDAAVGAYPGWGGYGTTKAALDHLSAVLAEEHPHLRVFAFDPGDMATQMQQEAFPDEDISNRASPADVVPRLLNLVAGDLPSGRYRASQFGGVGVLV